MSAQQDAEAHEKTFQTVGSRRKREVHSPVQREMVFSDMLTLIRCSFPSPPVGSAVGQCPPAKTPSGVLNLTQLIYDLSECLKKKKV